jgi:hypothetical protein
MKKSVSFSAPASLEEAMEFVVEAAAEAAAAPPDAKAREQQSVPDTPAMKAADSSALELLSSDTDMPRLDKSVPLEEQLVSLFRSEDYVGLLQVIDAIPRGKANVRGPATPCHR